MNFVDHKRFRTRLILIRYADGEMRRRAILQHFLPLNTHQRRCWQRARAHTTFSERFFYWLDFGHSGWKTDISTLINFQITLHWHGAKWCLCNFSGYKNNETSLKITSIFRSCFIYHTYFNSRPMASWNQFFNRKNQHALAPVSAASESATLRQILLCIY